MTTFRDAITDVIGANVVADVGDPWDWEGDPAAAVLAMPEMAEIRRALRDRAFTFAVPEHSDVLGPRHDGTRMPEHLRAWVLGEDQ